MNRLPAHRTPLRSLVAASALSLGLAAAGHALAGPPEPVATVKVSFADLDLDKQAGAETLYSRIQSAAGSVCGRVDAREIERHSQYRRCFDDTVQAALKQVNRSSLYAVHNRKTGAPTPG